jgi:ABC-type transporter Mla subunit MlaD
LKTALYFLLSLLVLTVTGSVLVLSYDCHQDLRDAHQNLSSLNQVLGQASATAKHLDQTVVKVDAVVGILNGAATEERESWKATSRETAKTARDVRELVDDFRKTALHVNLVTLPAVDSQITSNGDQLEATIHKLGESADGVTAIAGTLNTQLTDPQVAELLGHVNVISANLETISANSALMSTDMQLAVHRMAAPPTKFHQFLNVAWTTARFGSLFVP